MAIIYVSCGEPLAQCGEAKAQAGEYYPVADGIINVAEKKDSSNIILQVIITGSLSKVENKDSLASIGIITNISSGSISYLETKDNLSSNGQAVTSGAVSKTENKDISNIASQVITSGSVVKTENEDTAFAGGQVISSGLVDYTNENDNVKSFGNVLSQIPEDEIINNTPQNGDVVLFQSLDGGEIEINNGLIEMNEGLQTSVYLSLFGGNDEDDKISNQEFNKSWWGNYEEEELNQIRSETQFLLKSLPATSSNLRKLEITVKRDLDWMIQSKLANNINVSASIPALNTIKLNIEINNESYEFIENWRSR